MYWENFSVYESTRQSMDQLLILRKDYDPDKLVPSRLIVTKKLCVLNKSTTPLDLFCEKRAWDYLNCKVFYRWEK